ncbi:MAG: SusD/RagB family nutrient-binding outer membrane lipoprotein [Cyclobacteriaceae bacterium]|nr:SusD/RagB family nutrient-binding outer membrane lipoprotein [Cyclobacteriaceae bacterium]
MKKIILVLFLMAVVSVSCDDRLVDLNTPRKAATVVPGQTLFTNGLKEMVDQLQTINVNLGVFKLYSQYWAQATYPEESQYNMVTRNIPENMYENMYRDALRDLTDGRAAIEALGEGALASDIKKNQLATFDVIMVWTWSFLVDTFGHVPYDEALDPENLNPAYGDMGLIYTSIIDKLDAAISALDPNVSGISAAQDPVYNGDVAAWKVAANSLKFRLAMRLADSDPGKSVSMANAALSSGIITSNADNFALNYLVAPPNTNPQYEDLVLSGRSDFIGANTLVDKMNGLNDPRRPIFFKQNLGDGVYEGGIYGDANSFKNFSQIGDIFHTPDLPGTIINASEMHFLMAEAVERGGYSVSGTAEAHYNAGITASMEEWGVAAADIPAYLAQPEVAYATAEGPGASWKQKIGTQFWLAMFNNGYEGWTVWRRLDFDGFTPPPGMQMSDIPLRFIYPINEGQRNKANKDEAAGRLSAGDTPQSNIFWDVN